LRVGLTPSDRRGSLNSIDYGGMGTRAEAHRKVHKRLPVVINNLVMNAASDSESTGDGVIGAAVSIDRVRRTFAGGVTAVDDFSLDVPAGEFIALLGPSGCGKSTLLRLLAGLDRPTAGAVSHDAMPSRGARGRLAYVFQDAHLLPWATALDNAALPLKLAGVPRRERRRQAEAMLVRVGLGTAAARYPAQLSGGMKMRVSLARALVTDPALLLLDEPFAALDEITRQQLDDLLISLWQPRRPTVVFVTHSIQEATYLARRVVVLAGPPARIVADRPIQLPWPRTAALRATPEFAQQTHALFEALRAATAETVL
jgi:NitT/TauT family transport system ATP-binding protein